MDEDSPNPDAARTRSRKQGTPPPHVTSGKWLELSGLGANRLSRCVELDETTQARFNLLSSGNLLAVINL